MQQIADWLEKLGMSEYAQRFAENRIDLSVLPELTDQHLKDLGIALGDRLKMLRAIRELSNAAAPTPEPPPAQPKPQETAERRQVTVMFSDLVGSTALSARMDPEDLREVISAYQKCVAETVQRFGGFVAKFMGDGVLIYFGYPQAHEDDAERAVRAGLELVAAVSDLKTPAPLQTRVGIATGLVVVGDLIGSGASQEQAIVGETPNLAARLQGVAEPNSVVIAESTRKLVGNLFELQDLGAQDLKGIGGSVRAWAALRQAPVESRFEAFHASGLTELVGREEELEILLRRWSKAKRGEGQVVLLSGEPGIGKSRLTAALLERLATEPHTRLRYFCSPQHTDSALYPIISQMERAAGFAHDDTAQSKLDKLDALLAQSFTSHQDAALFAGMLSLPNDGRYPTSELAPQQRRQKILEALTAQPEALSQSKPVLMIFEDVHWSDPTSLETLSRTADRLRTLGVLLIITYRPEFEPPWLGRPYVAAISLNRLGEREIVALIDHVTGNKLLSSSIRQDIVERTDGIPLFAEEMTKAVLEAGGEQAAERAAASVPSPSVAVPASLHASLMARLDRLGSAKEVAQTGATIGREFPYSLIAAVMGKPDAELQSALSRVVAAGLLFRQGVPPHATYLFKHALVQDAAYGTLLRDARRALHARIADILESQFTEIAENQPELLARHYTEAGLIERAAGFWGTAGQRSLQLSANVEAAKQLRHALQQIAALPASPRLRRDEIKFQVAYANALMHTKGYAAPETKMAFDQAHELIERAEAIGEPSENPLLLFSILYGMWAANFVAFKGHALRELSAQFLALAKKQTASAPIMIGHRLVATSLTFTGDLVEGCAHYDRALAIYDPTEHRPLATRFGQDVGVVILSFRSWALWLLGYPEASRRDIESALKNAREIGHVPTLMYSLFCAAGMQIYYGNYLKANELAGELLALAEEKDAMLWTAASLTYQGCTSMLIGNAAVAVDQLTSGIRAWRSTGATLWMPLYLPFLARARAALGQFDDALHCIEEATAAATKEAWWEAEDSVSPVRQIDFHFEAVRVKPPVSDAAAALIPALCSLYGAFGAPCATDHNALLEALVWMTVDAEQAFEKDHSISAQGDCYLRSHRRQWVG